MMNKTLTIFLAFVSVSALADDSRIREEEYSRKKVYTVYARIGSATLIELQAGETIDPTKTDASVLGIGFGSAWTLGVRENNLVFKPKNIFPDTNMVIVTNKRRYVFDLKLAPKKIEPTYVLSFTYPEDEKKAEAEKAGNISRIAAQAAAAQAAKDKITAEAKAQKVAINTNYYWKGDNALLAPTAAWDDGRFTYLEYHHAGELPTFFKILPDGTEAQINANVNPSSGDETVLQEVTRIIRARLGNDVIEIINRNFAMPQFNTTGSSVHGTVRVEKAGGVRNAQ